MMCFLFETKASRLYSKNGIEMPACVRSFTLIFTRIHHSQSHFTGLISFVTPLIWPENWWHTANCRMEFVAPCVALQETNPERKSGV